MATPPSHIKVIADIRIPSVLAFSALVLIVLPLAFVSSRDDNNQGVRLLNDKNVKEAVSAFQRAIDKNYLHPAAHLNLALSRDLEGDSLKALKIYSFVADTFKGSIPFYSHFNQGELRGRLGHKARALAGYQAALAFAVETEKIKQNMEWLFLMSQNDQGKAGSDRQNKNGSENQARKGEGGGSDKKDSDADSSPKGEQNGQNQKDRESESGQEKQGQHSQRDQESGEEEKDQDRPDQGSKEGQKNQEAKIGQNENTGGGEGTQKKGQKKSSLESGQSNPSSPEGKDDTKDKEKPGQPSSEDPLKKEEQDRDSQSSISKGKLKGARHKESGDKKGAAFSAGKILDEIETKAILDAIEKQESDIRKRLFQNKSRRRQRPGEKDW